MFRFGNTRRQFALVCLLAVIGVVGCGGRYSVKGRVTYPDGSPVTEGNVIGQVGEGTTSVSVQGNIDRNGYFSLGTERPSDGVKPGKYRFIVVCRALGDAELSEGKRPAIDSKYANVATSGIEFEVTSSGKNELNITVTRPAEKK